MERIFTLDDINEVAIQFWEKWKDKKVFAFYGEMAAGKTTFIHALCKIMKVQDVVTSPTYAIVNEYAHDHGNIFHIDLYRLKNEEEVLQSGVQDCIYSGQICFIEWPEKAPGIFPDDTINVFIQSIDEHSRSIRILEN